MYVNYVVEMAANAFHATPSTEHPGYAGSGSVRGERGGADSPLPLVPDYADDDHDGPSATVAVELSRHAGRDGTWCFNRKEAKDHGEGEVIVGARTRYGVAE